MPFEVVMLTEGFASEVNRLFVLLFAEATFLPFTTATALTR